MKIHTKAVHAGDRKKPGVRAIPVTTPIHTASSYFYESMEQLDRVFGREETGYCYARYDNPTNAALEELVRALESGHGALACASGMAALHMAIVGGAGRPAQIDRGRRRALRRHRRPADERAGARRHRACGSSISATWTALRAAVAEAKPGCILMETISNPLLRVAPARPHRRNRARGRRGAGRGQHLRHAAAGAAAGTGRALQRAQR